MWAGDSDTFPHISVTHVTDSIKHYLKESCYHVTNTLIRFNRMFARAQFRGQQKWTWKVIRSRWERIVLASDSARANNSPPTHSGKISNRMKLSTKTRRWHLNGNTSRMLTIMAGKLQRRKTMTTQRSILASPSSRAWLLKGSFILGFVSDVTKQNDIFICPHQW